MKRYKSLIYLACFSLLVGMTSCFNLDEDPFSEIDEEAYSPSDSDEVAFLARAYSPLRFFMSWQGLFDLQEEPGDAIVTPTRPEGWDDGGTYKRMHYHTWNETQWQPRNTWLRCFDGINNANQVLLKAEEGYFPEENVPALVAELRAVRALCYSILCDTHGNVPILESYTDNVPLQATRKEVFDFVVKELTEVLPLLIENVNPNTYGRLTQWGARCVLMRMYLNAEVYIGTPMWEEALEECNKIIESGYYQLEPNYTDIFKTDNEYCLETIFAIAYDEVYTNGVPGDNYAFSAHMKFLSSDSREVYNMQASPWNGSGANPQFINSYHELDNRRGYTWLEGEQRDGTTGEVIFSYVNKLPSLYSSEKHDGLRVGKYEIKTGAKSVLSNDFPYFRYTEVLLTKAECLMRLGRDMQEAANLITEIRRRAFDNEADARVTIADLQGDTKIKYGTLNEKGEIDKPGDQTPVYLGGIYDEWGWEFAAEGRRRIDMIRFGTYQTKSWFNHTPVGDHTTLFMIALEELNTNTNLKQNPGY